MEANALTNLGTAVTQVLTWMGDTLETITSNPILLVSFAIFVVGAGIGLAKRMFS